MQCDTYAPGEVKICADGVESARELVRLFRRAERFVFFSSFLCDLTHPLPLPGGDGLNLQILFRELTNRGVAVHILYNNETAYSKLTVAEFRKMLPRAVHVRAVSGSGHLPPVARLFCTNTSFTNHHQKYVCVDGVQMMLGGTDINAQRAGWLQSNDMKPVEYCWHETSITVPCTPRMLEFVVRNFRAIEPIAPFPLLRGGASEHAVMLHLIKNARSCIHMEAQTCISANTTANTVFTAVARRVARAFSNPRVDRFHFFFLTNEFQIDENNFVSNVSREHLHWSRRHLWNEMRARGVPPDFIDARVFFGFMEAPRQRHIKIHSNMMIQDGHTLLRSSSNFTDRSLSPRPCDNELGILIHGQVVAHFQQKMWRRYFGITDSDVLLTPEASLRRMVKESGVIRRYRPRWFSATIPNGVVNVAMSLIHSTRFFGGREKITWKVSSDARAR